MKLLIRFLFPVLFFGTPVGVYVINPFDVPTDNIRPRISGHDLYRVPSRSMVATLMPGDYILISNIAYKNKSQKIGEVIVFNRKTNNNPTKKIPFIKRVIGVAGDTIKIKDGFVQVNEKTLNETYVLPENKKRAYSRFHPTIHVPNGMLFVMGDNRDNSKDSRIFGFISVDDVIGQAIAIIYGNDDQAWESLVPKEH